MSCEESYLAIMRYLTDEREPYAPGTPGNTKRKIRKAAACYVVRNGTLFYQRRQKGQNEFTELEVVLRDSRRKELINQAHILETGEHLNQPLTWEVISQKYWWRGILKNVKDHIKECSDCQSRRGADDSSGPRPLSRQGKGRAWTGVMDEEEYEEEEDEGEDSLFGTDLSSLQKSRLAKGTTKHEVVFVDSKGEVNRFLPKHSQTMLGKLNKQRLDNQFCDITLLIEGEEYRAHKAVLAACSEYFNELFFEKGAVTTHEAVVDLSGFAKASFLPLLDFAYTSMLTFNFCIMADIANLARHLLMTEVLEICESVHKQVEEQKLAMFQRRDAGTGPAAAQDEGSFEQPETFMVTIQEDGSTMVTHSANEAFVISVDPDKASSSEDTLQSVKATHQDGATEVQKVEAAPAPVKRKRGRPPKLKKEVEVEEYVPLEEPASASEDHADEQEATSDDPRKRRLRQRSMVEGGYARLHMGVEEEEEGKRELGTEEATVKESEPEGGVKPDQAPSGSATDGEHTCSECGMSFPRRYSLIMHTLKHEKTRGYKCSLCSKEFQYAASLQAHLARHKKQGRQRVPTSRNMAEGSEGREEGDLDGTSPLVRREFVCDICGKTLPKLYSLRIHMLNHTGVRPHSCKVCGKTFAHKHSLKMHRALHDVTKQFQCEFCKKLFVSKRSMEEHTSLHTGESKYLCNTCGATFHRASALSKHLKKHQPKPEVRPFTCSHCDKSFYEAKDLQQHMNKHMGLKPFQCQVCGKCYSWKKDWYSHVKSHSVAEPFKCNVCGKEFFEKALFRRHVKKATHGKKGRVKQNLERECLQCGRKFTQLREFRRHINNHQGVKPFECLTCGVAWADARSLKRHVRTHTGERPYVCPMCQDAHIDARSLRKHMAKYHVDSLPGKIMLEKDTLQFHNQGTQVEHAVSILASDLPPELRPAQQPATDELETVLITEETVETVQAVQAVTDGSVATLSDQGIMQVVNYVLAQQALSVGKPEETPEVLQAMEVEVANVAEVE
uniref:Zinc finger and BTB domain containing 11 n=1 Tax=Nothobranchius furzeri TaxID=105023 RepID=A0A8C6NXS5_NOTFU